MTGERSISIARNAVGSVFLTGDHNRVVFEQRQREGGPEAETSDLAEDFPSLVRPADTSTILAAFEAASSELLHWRRVLPGGEAFTRPELEVLRQRLTTEGPRITMLLGGPGSGKSALLRELAEALRAAGTIVLAIKADSMPAETETPETLRQWLGLPASADACLRAVANSHRCVLIVDQLDALCQIVDIRTKRLDLLTRLEQIAG